MDFVARIVARFFFFSKYYIELKKTRSSDIVWLVGSRLVGALSEILSEPCRMACRTSLSEWLVGVRFFHVFGLALVQSSSAL